jgi:tripartite-type tricarboxylate transporter receptor subunit TctC
MLVVVLLVFSFAGCSNGTTETAPSDEAKDSSEPVAEEKEDEIAFPEKSITIIVPYSPGGSSDLSARPLAEAMGKSIGQSVVVMNKPGASGSIGAAEAVGSAPDGYTLFNGSNGNTEILPYTRDVGYTAADLKPVARTVTAGLTVAVGKNSPFNTLEELIAYAKENPGTLQCGTPGVAGLHHLTLEAFKDSAGIDIVNVPFEGATPAMAALLGGHIDMTISTTVEVSGHYKTGEMKILATSQAGSPERLEAMPDIPSFTELGIDIMLGSWYGILVPKDTPDEIVNILTKEIEKALESPDVLNACEKLTLTPSYANPEELAAQMEADVELNVSILKKIGMYSEN